MSDTRYVRTVVLISLLLATAPVFASAGSAATPNTQPAGSPQEGRSFWDRQEGAADVELDDLKWLAAGLSSDDLRKLLNGQALPNVESLCDLLHQNTLTDEKQRATLEIFEANRGQFEAYASQLKSVFGGRTVNGERVVQRKHLGDIRALDLRSGTSELPMPESLKQTLVDMIAAGGHRAVRALIDSGQIDLDTSKILAKIRNDISEEVMTRLIMDVGHPVHTDNYSKAMSGRSDEDITFGDHKVLTWLAGREEDISSQGAALVQRYRELFQEAVSQKYGKTISAAAMDIALHDVEGRLPDPVLFYEDNARYTAVMRQAMGTAMANPEAYFFEGGFRAFVDRPSYENELRSHSIYTLTRTPSGEADVLREDYLARDKVYEYLRPELQKGHASGMAMSNWVFFRRHGGDRTPTTLIDQSKYPVRAVDAVALKAGKYDRFFGGVENMPSSRVTQLLRQAFPGGKVGDMSIEDAQRVIEVAGTLRRVSKGKEPFSPRLLRPYEDKVLSDIQVERHRNGLRPGSPGGIRHSLGDDQVAELARQRFQADAEKFMLNVVVETADDRIKDYLDPQINRQRLVDLANRRVPGAPNKAVTRAQRILARWDDPEMKARYSELAELELAQIGLALRKHRPDYFQRFMGKFDFDPALRTHFDRLMWHEDLVAWIRKPRAGTTGQLYRSTKYQAVEAMRSNWEAMLQKRQALRTYAEIVTASYQDLGLRDTASWVLSDLGKKTGGAARLNSARAAQSAKWGANVAAYHLVKDLGISFPDLDKSLHDYRKRGGGTLTWGQMKWSFSDFLKSNIGLGQVDSVLTVLQAYQQQGGWNEVSDQIFWREVYTSIPLVGPIYGTWLNANAGNVLGLAMQWGPVYAAYAYGEAVASAVASPLIALTVFNITYKIGTIWSYEVFNGTARDLFFGFDPAAPQIDSLLPQVQIMDPSAVTGGTATPAPANAPGSPGLASAGSAAIGTEPLVPVPSATSAETGLAGLTVDWNLFELNASLAVETQRRQEQSGERRRQVVEKIRQASARMDDSQRTVVNDLLQTAETADPADRDQAIADLSTLLGSVSTDPQLSAGALRSALSTSGTTSAEAAASGMVIDLNPTISTTSTDATSGNTVTIDPHAPISRDGPLPDHLKRRPGLLDIVPGKTLAERKVKLYEWMETYTSGNTGDKPFSVMQSVDTEVRMFNQQNGLLPNAGESAEEAANRQKRAAELEPRLNELVAKTFQEKMDLKCRALAVEFLRGDVWDDRVFGPMRDDIRRYYDFWRKKPDVLEHLIRLIKEHYMLGMNVAKGAEAIAEGSRQTAEAQLAWAANDLMEQVITKGVSEMNGARSEEIWAWEAMPTDPHWIDVDDLQRHLEGDFPGLTRQKEGEVEIKIDKPDHPWPVPSIDSIGMLQLAATVKVPAHKFKRPFDYRWTVNNVSATPDQDSGLAQMKGDLAAGKTVPVRLEVIDLIGRRIGEATEEIQVAPPPIRFAKLTLTHRDKPDEVLYEAETLDAEQKVASGHGYQLAVEALVHEPGSAFDFAGVGLVPASVMEKVRASLSDPSGSLDAEPEELQRLDPESLVPMGYQYLWRQLSHRASGETAAAQAGPDGLTQPQKVTRTISLVRETDIGDDEYYLFAVASNAGRGRHFLLSPQKIILRRADQPGVTWKIAALTRQAKDAQGQLQDQETNLLALGGIVRPVVEVRKGQKGELRFAVNGSTDGVKPETLEIGIEKRDDQGRFDGSSYQRIASGSEEQSPGEYTCHGKWDATSAALGVYRVIARIRIPKPDAAHFVPETLESRSELWPLIQVLPKQPDDLVDQLQNDANQLTTGGGATRPGGTTTQSGQTQPDEPGQTQPAIDPDELIQLVEQAQTEAVAFKSTLVLQRTRRDGQTSVGDTFFSRGTACRPLPTVRVENVYPGMKIRISVGYIDPQKTRKLLDLTELVTGDENQPGQFELDLSKRSELGNRWVNRDLFRGPHVAYLHVTVISRSGRHSKGPDKIELPFVVQEEGLGEVVFEGTKLFDTAARGSPTGTQFWDDAKILVRCSCTVSEVYGTESIRVRHRFTLRDPQGRSLTWKTDPITDHAGGGPLQVDKPLGLQTPLKQGTWNLRHEIVEVTDADGMAVLRPGLPRQEHDITFRIVEPKAVVTGGENVYQIQHPPPLVRGAPVSEFTKPDQVPCLHLKLQVTDVPVDCNMRCLVVWQSPDTGSTTQQSGEILNIKEGELRLFTSQYRFKNEDYDGIYTCQATLNFSRGGHGIKLKLPLSPLRFRLKGRERPGQKLEDVAVDSRNVVIRLWDDGSAEDDVINVYVDGQRIASNVKLLFIRNGVKELKFTIPPDRNEVLFEIEHVESPVGENTAAVEFVGAIDARLRQQGWHLSKPGQRASCIVSYKPPAPPPDPNTGTPPAPSSPPGRPIP